MIILTTVLHLEIRDIIHKLLGSKRITILVDQVQVSIVQKQISSSLNLGRKY